MQTDIYLLPYTEIKSKWIEDLNMNPFTLKLIGEKIGSNLEHSITEDYFLNTPVAQTLRLTINKLLKLRCLCKAKNISVRQNGQRSSPTPYVIVV